jgi:hypothetical protein
MNNACRKALLALFISLMFTGVLWAQSDLGTISGYVRDPSGAMVPNAKITLQNQASGIQRGATTDQSGHYVLTNVPPGFYTLSAEAAGFKKYETKDNKLDPSAVLSVDASLAVGATTETVEVVAAAAVLQTQSPTVQKLVTREQIDGLELNGRNPVFLAMLQPGVRGGTLGGQNYGLSLGPGQINGSRSQENLITFDGAPAVRTRANGTSIGVADVDSTQEVQVLTASYNAEYGRSSGGQVRIITRSGGRDFHGTAYEYLKNTNLNANSWSRNSNPATAFTAPMHYNQYGFNVGGPFYIPNKFNADKSKFFWYWGDEWLKYHYMETPTLTVPTALMRQGDFGELLSSNPIRSVAKVYDPLTCPTTGSATCTQFPNNQIPKGRQSANGIGLLNAYPTPNVAGGGFVSGNRNWVSQGAHPVDVRKDTLAVDMNLSDKQRLTFRRQNYSYLEYQPFDGGSDRMPKWFIRPNQTNSLDYVWTIGPRLVNEVLATVSLDGVFMPVNNTAAGWTGDRTKYGINYPYLFSASDKMVPNRVPDIVISNFSNLTGGPYPSHSSGPIYDLSDSLTWVRGNHTLKFGALYERSGQNDFDQINVAGVPGGTNNQNGRFAFSDGHTGGGGTSGLAIANAALGLFDVYAEIGQRSYTIYRGSMFEAFAQDGWKATSKLKVDYGVRWTVVVPYRALWGNMDVWDRRYYDPAKAVQQDPKSGYVIAGTGDRYNGLVIPGSGVPDAGKGRVQAFSTSQFNYLFRGLSDHYSEIHWGLFQPRLGLAYQLTDKMVIRAGVGRYTTRLGVSDSIFMGGNAPFQPMASVSNGSVDNPGGGPQNYFPFSITTQSLHFKNPEAWNWNFTLEREMPFKTFLTVGYVGRRGLHLQQEMDLNQLAPGTIQANSGINTDYLRPYKGFGVIRETDNVASSRYNSLQVNWTRRWTGGLAFGMAYTFSKSTDNGSAQRDIIPFTFDRSMLYGPSDFDTRHLLVINYIYELPFLRGQTTLVGKLLGGWQISGITQAQTGTPSTVATGTDFAGVGTLGSMSGMGQMWAMTGTPTYTRKFAALGASDSNQWFTTKNPDGTAIFTAPAAGTYVRQTNRNKLYSPGLQNWNIALFKRFPITERTGFQFRLEAYNFPNHPNWGGVDFSPTSGTFGKVTSKSSERQLQLSLRFAF